MLKLYGANDTGPFEFYGANGVPVASLDAKEWIAMEEGGEVDWVEHLDFLLKCIGEQSAFFSVRPWWPGYGNLMDEIDREGEGNWEQRGNSRIYSLNPTRESLKRLLNIRFQNGGDRSGEWLLFSFLSPDESYFEVHSEDVLLHEMIGEIGRLRFCLEMAEMRQRTLLVRTEAVTLKATRQEFLEV